MEFAYTIGGGAPHMKKFIVDTIRRVVIFIGLLIGLRVAAGDHLHHEEGERQHNGRGAVPHEASLSRPQPTYAIASLDGPLV